MYLCGKCALTPTNQPYCLAELSFNQSIDCRALQCWRS